MGTQESNGKVAIPGSHNYSIIPEKFKFSGHKCFCRLTLELSLDETRWESMTSAKISAKVVGQVCFPM